jgi:Iap family predicted aminopeptidase
MRCDRFEYSSERLDTGVSDIDNIETQYSLSTDIVEKALVEDGDFLVLEDGTYILSEGDIIVSAEVAADNELIGQKIIDDDILDFSEQNPFSLTRTF